MTHPPTHITSRASTAVCSPSAGKHTARLYANRKNGYTLASALYRRNVAFCRQHCGSVIRMLTSARQAAAWRALGTRKNSLRLSSAPFPLAYRISPLMAGSLLAGHALDFLESLSTARPNIKGPPCCNIFSLRSAHRRRGALRRPPIPPSPVLPSRVTAGCAGCKVGPTLLKTKTFNDGSTERQKTKQSG